MTPEWYCCHRVHLKLTNWWQLIRERISATLPQELFIRKFFFSLFLRKIQRIDDFILFFLSNRHSSKTNLNIKAGGEPQQFQAPTFLTEPMSKTANEGETVTLDCVANGNPKPQIKWLRNGEDIEINESNPKFRIIGTGSLQIVSVAETDAGNYQCRASNSMESADIEISLLVQVPPKFIQSPTDRIAYEKDELEMVCAIRGKPTPIVQWLKNGDVITPNDYMQIVNG